MSSKDYRISPPPQDKGEDILFRIVYSIDVSAHDEIEAVQTAWEIIRAEDAMDPVLVILDGKGKQIEIDLSTHMEVYKITTGFVSQRYRRQSSGEFKCIDQEFVAGDDVQFENFKGEIVDPPEHDYQPFNMTMLSKDEIINRLVDIQSGIDVGGEQSRQFSQEIYAINELLKELGWKQKDKS